MISLISDSLTGLALRSNNHESDVPFEDLLMMYCGNVKSSVLIQTEMESSLTRSNDASSMTSM